MNNDNDHINNMDSVKKSLFFNPENWNDGDQYIIEYLPCQNDLESIADAEAFRIEKTMHNDRFPMALLCHLLTGSPCAFVWGHPEDLSSFIRFPETHRQCQNNNAALVVSTSNDSTIPSSPPSTSQNSTPVETVWIPMYCHHPVQGRIPVFAIYPTTEASCMFLLDHMLIPRKLPTIFDLDETLVKAYALKGLQQEQDDARNRLTTVHNNTTHSAAWQQQQQYEEFTPGGHLNTTASPVSDANAAIPSSTWQVLDSDSIERKQAAVRADFQELHYFASNNRLTRFQHQTQYVNATYFDRKSQAWKEFQRPWIDIPEENILFTRIEESHFTSMLFRVRQQWREQYDEWTVGGGINVPIDAYVCTAGDMNYAHEVWRVLDKYGMLIPRHQCMYYFLTLHLLDALLLAVLCSIQCTNVHDCVCCIEQHPSIYMMHHDLAGTQKITAGVKTHAGETKSIANVLRIPSPCHPFLSAMPFAVVLDDCVDVWRVREQKQVINIEKFSPYDEDAILGQMSGNRLPLTISGLQLRRAWDILSTLHAEIFSAIENLLFFFEKKPFEGDFMELDLQKAPLQQYKDKVPRPPWVQVLLPAITEGIPAVNAAEMVVSFAASRELCIKSTLGAVNEEIDLVGAGAGDDNEIDLVGADSKDDVLGAGRNRRKRTRTRRNSRQFQRQEQFQQTPNGKSAVSNGNHNGSQRNYPSPKQQQRYAARNQHAEFKKQSPPKRQQKKTDRKNNNFHRRNGWEDSHFQGK